MNSNPSTFSVIGLMLSASFIGANLAISRLNIPSIILKPSNASQNASSSNTQMARQWRDVYDKGKKAGPFLGGLTLASWLYAAKQLSGNRKARNLHIAGALFALSIVPFTFIVMQRTISELQRRAVAGDVGKEITEASSVSDSSNLQDYPTRDLIWWWGQLNLMRAALPLVGIVCVAVAGL